MRVGSRIVYPEEVKKYDMEIIQISVYRQWPESIPRMKDTVEACRQEGIPFVIHPVGYSLLDPDHEKDLLLMAQLTEESFIVHDERSADGKRITSAEQERYRSMLGRLREHTPVSIENAADTVDVLWFWEMFDGPITLDLGHMEAAGLDSVRFIKDLPDILIKRAAYVHIHRNGEFRNGLTDHWYLLPDCRELEALRVLAGRKDDISVILEINEIEQINDSLLLLRQLRETL